MIERISEIFEMLKNDISLTEFVLVLFEKWTLFKLWFYPYILSDVILQIFKIQAKNSLQSS